MTTISVTTILASKHAETGHRIDTLVLRYPRWIHAEFMTHRVFSRNASSSRAIPVSKLIEDIYNDPAVPLFWGKNQKGMQAQAGEECNEPVRDIFIDDGSTLDRTNAWCDATITACNQAQAFADAGYHKQIANRLLEPFSHINVVVTATEWDNFFTLRDHDAAEPHIRLLAQKIKEARDGAYVQTLQPGEWHLPFIGKYDILDAVETHPENVKAQRRALKRLSVARSASVSYKTVEGFDMTMERADAIYDKLFGPPLHASPFEHVAQADWQVKSTTSLLWMWANPANHRNFTGFRQLRSLIETGHCHE